MRRQATDWGLIDSPGEGHRTHTVATPLGGGLAIYAGTVMTVLIGLVVVVVSGASLSDIRGSLGLVDQAPSTQSLWAIIETAWALLAAGGLMMLLGLADDRWRIHWGIRLVCQLIVATGYVLLSDIRLTVFIESEAVQGGLTVLWIVALVNAMNMLDNMNGLSAGVGAICAASLAATLLIGAGATAASIQIFVAGLSIVLVGSLVGFLPHNFPNARLFMGDAGSYFVGFMLAVLTMLGTYASYDADSRHAVLAPLCLLAVPLYDMVTVIVIRLRSGRSPFHADRNHLSHRLVAHGFSCTQAVVIIYLMTAACGLAAMVLGEVGPTGATLVGLWMVCLLGLVAMLETRPSSKG